MTKKHIFAVALAVLMLPLLAQTLRAQSEFGVKGGINYFKVIRSGPSSNLEFKWKDGLSTGVFYNSGKLWGPLGIQAELLYQMKGSDILLHDYSYGYPYGYTIYESGEIVQAKGPSYSSDRLHYLNLPILINVSTGKLFDFYAGPELGYLISDKTQRMGTGNLNKFSVGMSAGAKLKLCTNTSLDFRYSYDFSNYDSEGVQSYSSNYKNQGFIISIQQTLFRK